MGISALINSGGNSSNDEKQGQSSFKLSEKQPADNNHDSNPGHPRFFETPGKELTAGDLLRKSNPLEKSPIEKINEELEEKKELKSWFQGVVEEPVEIKAAASVSEYTPVEEDVGD